MLLEHKLIVLGTVEFTPIHFLHKSLDFDELLALYAVSDVCLITSTRDGMNLVCYEYIATQQRRHGVLVLSEFTGAAQSLTACIIVNPWNTEELAEALLQAVTMSDEQRATNFMHMYDYVSAWTRCVVLIFLECEAHTDRYSAYWAQSFVRNLRLIPESEDTKPSKVEDGKGATNAVNGKVNGKSN